MSDARPAPPETDPYPHDAPRPLANLGGRRPQAPTWFEATIAAEPPPVYVTHQGLRLETRAWGPQGAPGVLLLHGNLASARWWSFIAPFISERRRVVTLSFSGMGLSDAKPDGVYPPEDFLAQAMTAARHHGLFSGGARPVVIGHSAGGSPAIAAAADHAELIAGAILVDCRLQPPEFWSAKTRLSRPHAVYRDMATALARFRLAPPQPCENLFLVDYIARTSLKQVEGGYTWRFDPALWNAFNPRRSWEKLLEVKVPVAFLNGARSSLMTPDVVDRIRQAAPRGSPIIAIPEAYHHVMLDQPLALAAELNRQLDQWSSAASPEELPS